MSYLLEPKTAANYDDLFKPLLALAPQVKSNIDAEIVLAKRIFKKSNRIIWWLRWYRIALADYLVYHQEPAKPGEPLTDGTANLRNLASKYWQEGEAKSGSPRLFGNLPPHFNPAKDGAWKSTRESFEHFYSIDYAPIQQFDPGFKTIDAVYRSLNGYDQEYAEQAKGTLTPEAEDSIFLDCGGGWAWWLLPRASCSTEAKAMGHCGNSPDASRTDMSILSLRQGKKVGNKDAWEPHLTFILHRLGDGVDSGTLGEMKGKGNDKPVPRYFPYIVKLLCDPRIKGMDGGGYLPEHNFSPKDLTEEQRKEVEYENPAAIQTLKQYYRANGFDEVVQARVAAKLNIPNEMGHDGYIIDSWTYDQFFTQCADREARDLNNYLGTGDLGFFADYALTDIDDDSPMWKGIAGQLALEFETQIDPTAEDVAKQVRKAMEGLKAGEDSKLRQVLEEGFDAAREAEVPDSQKKYRTGDVSLQRLMDEAINNALEDSSTTLEWARDGYDQVLPEDVAVDLALHNRDHGNTSKPYVSVSFDFDSDTMQAFVEKHLDSEKALDTARARNLEGQGQSRLFKRPDTDEEAERDGIKISRLLQPKEAIAVSETGKNYMALSGDKIIEEATIGDYEVFVLKSGIVPGLHLLGMQRTGADAFDLGQQAEKTPNSRGGGSLAELKSTIEAWLRKYGQLVIGSHNPAKSQQWIRLAKRMGFNVENERIAGIEMPMIKKTAYMTPREEAAWKQKMMQELRDEHDFNVRRDNHLEVKTCAGCGEDFYANRNDGDYCCYEHSDGHWHGDPEKAGAERSVEAAVKMASDVPQEARRYQDVGEEGTPAYGRAEDFEWHDEPAFDLNRIHNFPQYQMWAAEEVAGWDSDYAEKFDKAIEQGTTEPIIAVEGTDGDFYLWDGNHRTARAFELGVESLPAYVGYRKTASKMASDVPEYCDCGTPINRDNSYYAVAADGTGCRICNACRQQHDYDFCDDCQAYHNMRCPKSGSHTAKTALYWNDRTPEDRLARIKDWVERSGLTVDDMGRVRLYHGTPSATATKIRQEGLREGSHLAADPESAIHFAGRDRGLKQNQVVCFEAWLPMDSFHASTFVTTDRPLSSEEISLRRVSGAAKTAYIAPAGGELTVAIDNGQRPKVTISLDFGIVNFTRFAITFPTDMIPQDEVDDYARQAFEALLQDVTAFLVVADYPEDVIADALSNAEVAFIGLDGKHATDAKMPDQDPSIRMYESEFPLPAEFAQQTWSKVAATVEEQTKDITQTPAFKAWFNGSEVVDKQGRPQVMYHATQSDIGEFRPYTHFGTQQAANDRHSNLTEFFDNTLKNTKRGEGANIMPVYLSVKNALRLPDLASINDYGEILADFDKEYDEDDEEERSKRYPRGWEGEEAISLTLLEQGIIDIDQFEKMRGNVAALEFLKSKGYDGIVYENVVEDAGNDSWIVFSPNQIKSAIGNAGTFDAKSNSITASTVRGDLSTFMAAYEAQTEPAPTSRNPYLRKWADKVLLEVHPMGGRAYLHQITSSQKGVGDGSRALKFLCDLADQYGVTMFLAPVPTGKRPLDKDALASWYERYGFASGEGQYLVRKPTGSITASAVRRVPEVRELHLLPLEALTPPGTPDKVIEFFKGQSTLNTPIAFNVQVVEGPAPSKAKDWEERRVIEASA